VEESAEDTNPNGSDDAEPDTKKYELSAQLSMHGSPVRCVVVLDDDTIVSGGRKEGEFILWKRLSPQKKESEAATGNDDEKTNPPSPSRFEGSIIFNDDNFHPLTFCAVRSKGDHGTPRIISGGSDQRAVIWDIEGNIYQTLNGHSNSVNSVDVTDDGHTITGSFDSTAKLWDPSGRCVATLSGHEHGVEVCSLEDGQIVTGTLKHFHLWSKEGTLRKTVNMAHGHMIRKVRRHPLGFLTAANDGFVNLWSFSGESLLKTLAHREVGDTPSFVYGLQSMPNGRWLSSGEDGAAKIFSADGVLEQSLRHPAAVWDVALMPNGDVVTACADRTVRVWSNDPLRQMDSAAVEEYHQMLEMAKSAQKGGGGAQAVDESQLEPVSALSAAGKAGEFKMVAHPERGPSVFQWDGGSAQWQYIGQIMGKPADDDGRPQIDGVRYDFVTHIDLDGDAQIPLGFNKDDDPRQISRDFCVIHSIDLDLAQKIEAHLAPMADPVARAARLQRERVAAANALRHIPSFKKCEFEIHGKCNAEAMRKKLFQLNAEMVGSDDAEQRALGCADTADLDDLFAILGDRSNWHIASFPKHCALVLEQKLLRWPTSKVLPVLDMVRMFMLHQDAVDKLLANNPTVRGLIIGHIANDEECTASMQMVVARLLSNFLAKRKRGDLERTQNRYPVEVLEFLQEALSLMASAATNRKSAVHISYIMLAHNALIWFSRFKVEESDLYLIINSAMFELLTELEPNDKILFYSLLLIGSSAWASRTAKASIAEIFGDQLKAIVSAARQSKGGAATKEVANDLWNLFEMS